MDDHVIDCCSLLNLYTGWGGLAELRPLKRTWHVCEAVVNEAEYTREYGPDGAAMLVPLDVKALVNEAILEATRPETEQEVEDYVTFATEVDDGEAQALAIARNRGFILLTDDHKAATVAQRADVAVRTISTANVLQAWAQLNPANDARLRDVVTRITVLAKYRPRSDSAEFAWWTGYCQT